MKRVLSLVTVVFLVVVMLCSCTGQSSKLTKIGVTQIADHPSLDNCRIGFIQGLENGGFVEGENVEIEFQSAKNDMAAANQIASNFASTGKALVCGIATPSAQALYTACYDKGIPVVFNAVSDPVGAKLAKSKTETMDNITGISDALPVEDQLKLIRSIMPEAKKIGIIYTTSESNSISNIETYNALASKYGFEIVAKGIGNQSELAQVADIVLGQVDCISNLTDNTVVAALPILIEKAKAAKIPVFGSEEEQVKNGCIASAGLDYIKLGERAGEMAARILKGEDINSIPFEVVDESIITVSKTVAGEYGIEIPEDILSQAQVIGE